MFDIAGWQTTEVQIIREMTGRQQTQEVQVLGKYLVFMY